MLGSTSRHILHCLAYTLCVALFVVYGGQKTSMTDIRPIEEYGYSLTITLYVLQLLPLMVFPFFIENVLGLLMFNAFEDEVTLNIIPNPVPFICFRVVTRGNFPTLIKNNVERNKVICINAGLKTFRLEVVTDCPVGVKETPQTKEVVVPVSYRTQSGALYKSRALQYCLEDKINDLNDDDWIVHLDEETLLTTNAIYGILNFIGHGECKFGQGVITYANEEIVNWLTTLADCFRVAEDFGRMRWEIKAWHRPITGWKGSFMVVQAGAERKVGFDNGPDSSLIEDNFFSMKAIMQGYSFDSIDGEMWEKSPFTIWDFIQQRKRWMLGQSGLVHSSQFPFRLRCFSMLAFYCLAIVPIGPLVIVGRIFFPLPNLWYVDYIFRFIFGTTIYMNIFGAIKSYHISRFGIPKFLLAIAGVAVSLPFYIIAQITTVLFFYFSKRYAFYIVEKEDEKLSDIHQMPPV